MAYTNNVPQGSQQIASTQAPIEANFNFLQQAIGQEHNFAMNATDPTATYHLQASMPLKVTDPVALPIGTNGIYYVGSDGGPKYFNAFGAFKIQTAGVFQLSQAGTVNLTTSYTNVVTIPVNSVGQYFLFLPGTGVAGAYGQFFTGTALANISDLTSTSPNTTLNVSGLILQAKTDSSSFNGAYKWVIIYYTP